MTGFRISLHIVLSLILLAACTIGAVMLPYQTSTLGPGWVSAVRMLLIAGIPLSFVYFCYAFFKLREEYDLFTEAEGSDISSRKPIPRRVVKIFAWAGGTLIFCVNVWAYWARGEKTFAELVWFLIILALFVAFYHLIKSLRKKFGRQSLVIRFAGFPFMSLFLFIWYMSLPLRRPFLMGAGGNIWPALYFYFFGAIMGAIVCSPYVLVLKKKIENGKLLEYPSFQDPRRRTYRKPYVAMLVAGVAAFVAFVIIIVRYPAKMYLMVYLFGFFLGWGLYGLAWMYLYEKKHGIHIVVERVQIDHNREAESEVA